MTSFHSLMAAYLAVFVLNGIFLLCVETFAPELRANLWAAGYPERSLLLLLSGFVGFLAGVGVGRRTS